MSLKPAQSCAFYTEIKKPNAVETEQQYWERILSEAGLSVDAGKRPAHDLSYGWNDQWLDVVPFDYSLSHKRKDARGGRRANAGRKSKCFRYLSNRCGCSECVENSQKSKTPIREGSDGVHER